MLPAAVVQYKEWLHILQQELFQCVSISDVFQQILILWVLQPGWRPAGFDAGSVLQTVTVGC